MLISWKCCLQSRSRHAATLLPRPVASLQSGVQSLPRSRKCTKSHGESKIKSHWESLNISCRRASIHGCGTSAIKTNRSGLMPRSKEHGEQVGGIAKSMFVLVSNLGFHLDSAKTAPSARRRQEFRQPATPRLSRPVMCPWQASRRSRCGAADDQVTSKPRHIGR